MKPKIVKEEYLDDSGYFKIYWNNELIKTIFYTVGNNNPESIWSEEVNKKKAIEFAQKLKQNEGSFVTSEEVII